LHIERRAQAQEEATTDNSILPQKWLNRLQSSGYRLTSPRRAVIQILAKSQYALNPAQIYSEARSIDPEIGLVTVYRTLEKLEELGLVRRVHEIDGCHAYIAAPDGHQHLIVCLHCHRAQYIEGKEDLDPLMNDLGGKHGFEISDHWLQLFGVCPRCQENLDQE
jgi:Fe2+ or Zn2+ uptake regulation protein